MVILAKVKSKQRWSDSFIQPGLVGPVGDVHCQPRLKHSCPELPIRWEVEFTADQPRLGDLLSDGQPNGNHQVGDTNWAMERQFRTGYGWKYEEAIHEDALVQPYVGTTLDYDWRNKIATVYDSMRTGENFLPIPGPYQLAPGEISRGGQQVRVTDVIPGDEVAGGSVVVQGLNQPDNIGVQGYPVMPGGRVNK